MKYIFVAIAFMALLIIINTFSIMAYKFYHVHLPFAGEVVLAAVILFIAIKLSNKDKNASDKGHDSH